MDEHFEALKHGLTLEQFREARRISHIESHLQRQTAALALFLRFDPSQCKAVMVASNRLAQERVPNE